MSAQDGMMRHAHHGTLRTVWCCEGLTEGGEESDDENHGAQGGQGVIGFARTEGVGTAGLAAAVDSGKNTGLGHCVRRVELDRSRRGWGKLRGNGRAQGEVKAGMSAVALLWGGDGLLAGLGGGLVSVAGRSAAVVGMFDGEVPVTAQAQHRAGRNGRRCQQTRYDGDQREDYVCCFTNHSNPASKPATFCQTHAAFCKRTTEMG
jgi:hypothetical protein